MGCLEAILKSENQQKSKNDKSSSKTVTLDCQRGDFGLFRRLVGRAPCKAVLKHKEESRKAGCSSRKKSYRRRSRLKDRVLWKKTSLAELRGLAGSQEIKENL